MTGIRDNENDDVSSAERRNAAARASVTGARADRNIRATASNLLDRTKRETFRKYDGDSFAEILEARADGDIDEFEQERERSGRLFQVTLRAAF